MLSGSELLVEVEHSAVPQEPLQGYLWFQNGYDTACYAHDSDNLGPTTVGICNPGQRVCLVRTLRRPLWSFEHRCKAIHGPSMDNTLGRPAYYPNAAFSQGRLQTGSSGGTNLEPPSSALNEMAPPKSRKRKARHPVKVEDGSSSPSPPRKPEDEENV